MAQLQGVTTNLSGSTPVVAATWNRGLYGFQVVVSNFSGNPVYVTGSSTGTLATSYTLLPGFSAFLQIPASGSGTDHIYAFTDSETTATVSVLVNPS